MTLLDHCIEWRIDGKLHREDGPAIIWRNDDKEWYINGKLHREDGPAISYANGNKHWYQNGKHHREDGPAIEYVGGSKEWFINGKRHRVDGPAAEYNDGTKMWFLNDKQHRIGGPAVIWSNGDKCWLQNDKKHRLDGPAVEAKYTPFHRTWFVNGKELSFIKIRDHQRNRIQSLAIALFSLELSKSDHIFASNSLPPYVVLWILEWSEKDYIFILNQKSVIKMLEGVRNSINKIKEEPTRRKMEVLGKGQRIKKLKVKN